MIKAFEPPARMAVAGDWGSAPVLAGLRLGGDGRSTILHENVELSPRPELERLRAALKDG